MRKFLVAVVLGLGAASAVRAGDQPLRVAVFPFESDDQQASPGLKEFVQRAVSQEQGAAKRISFGEKVADLVSARLTGNPAVQLVERAGIDKAFDELALSKTGLVDDAAAVRVGRLVGAQALVTGKAFPVDGELFLVAKVVGVETGRVFAAKASGPLTGQLAPLAQALSDEVAKVVLKHDGELVGRDAAEKDYEALILKAVGEGPKPEVSVQVKERHMSRDTLDPAAETEVTYLLQKAGFTVVDEKNKPLGDWAQAYLEDSSLPPPKTGKAQVVFVGEAFSEFAARRGELVSCKARVELRAIDVKSGRVLSIGRRTATAVDIAEHIAAKAALQEAAAELALSLVPEVLKKWGQK